MADKPLEICSYFNQDDLARKIAWKWADHRAMMLPKINEWTELRDYIFATDTTSTTNSTLPWRNSTTLPKLCQIRDNLHSNYLSALFPNDDWLRWEAYSQADASKQKKDVITAYMSNKCREGGFRLKMSQLLLDYIDYGNAFAMPEFVLNYRTDANDQRVPGYIGPKAVRISPLDIVFNPTATSFEESYKIIRSYKSVGELITMADTMPDYADLKKALERREDMIGHINSPGLDFNERAEAFSMDGFGTYEEYLQSGYVEILEFYGDIHDMGEDTVERGHIVTIIDRMWVVRNVPFPSWFGRSPIYHVGWRLRPDNLWAMGPLDNLVGMQYRIDHLENAKADATDLAIFPPLVIAGNVEKFDWMPGSEIHVDEGGTVTELGRNAQWVVAANNDIMALEQRMEMYAGAPREAMGIRTAGEKTAFEVQQLQNAAGRIFQEKITSFETELMEPLLNGMLECARRNFQTEDIVRTLDDDLGATHFIEISREDITGSGVIRPIGARHFAAQAQLIQNLSGVMNGPMAQMLAPHISSKNLAKVIEDYLGLGRFSLFRPNVAIFEQQETQALAGQAQEDLIMEAAVGSAASDPTGSPQRV